MPQAEENQPLNQGQLRTLALLDYLIDWEKLNHTPVLDVTSHRAGFLAFQHELERLPGLRLNQTDASGEEIWLELERLKKSPPPEPESVLEGWVALANDPNVTPELFRIRREPDAVHQSTRLEEHPEVQEAFNVYSESKWTPWAVEEQPRRQSITTYDKLFHLQQTIAASGSENAVELVWGLGLVLWKTPLGGIRYPLITLAVEILPLSTDMILRIRPTMRPPQLELDPFLGLEIPETATFEASARTRIEGQDATVNPFDAETFGFVLQQAAASLDTHGQFLDKSDPGFRPDEIPDPPSHLLVRNSWVLFARNRRRSLMLDDVERLKQATERQGVPDGAPHRLVRDPSGIETEPPLIPYRGVSSTRESIGDEEVRDLYFPKPFNDEQLEIVRRLESQDGVVVQGPPGTGKTHTIANIVCHYLAHGRRVLVTSKGEPALAVLREQLPESIRDLAISLLTHEKEGKDQLERSVREIGDRTGSFRNDEEAKKITTLEKQIDACHRQIVTIDRELAEWASRNLQPVPAALGSVLPEDLARDVVKSAEAYKWFPDDLDEREEHEPPLDEAEIRALRDARRAVGNNLVYLGKPIPEEDGIPGTDELTMLHRSLLEKENLQKKREELGVPAIELHDPEVLKRAEELHRVTIEHCEMVAWCTDDWLCRVRLHYFQVSLRGEPVNAVYSKCGELLGEAASLCGRLDRFVASAIELPPGFDEDPKLLQAIRSGSNGERMVSWMPFLDASLREQIASIRFEESVPSSPETWALVAEYCDIWQASKKLQGRWNTLCERLGAPPASGDPLQAAQFLQQLEECHRYAHRLAAEYDAQLPSRSQRLFSEALPMDGPPERDLLDQLKQGLDIEIRRHRLSAARKKVDEVIRRFSVYDGDIFESMVRWLTRVGAPDFDETTLIPTWTRYLNQLATLRNCQPAFQKIRELTDRIESAGAKEWATNLRTAAAEPDGDQVLREDWRAAWDWSRKHGYLRRIEGRQMIAELSRKRDRAEMNLRRHYEDVVSCRTWLRLVEQIRSDTGIARAVVAYVQAITGMTKSGRGKRDNKLRQAAQEAMLIASRGIPCWIMPHWRVSEALPPILGQFDLIVIDEASQSDAWAIPALLRGKKALVVGDEKQVGPEPSFTRQEQIDKIQERLRAANIPTDIRLALDPRSSIYNLAELIFAGQTIRLREHFRCAEAIIQFSNRLCYQNEIKCVRIPTAEQRLLPVLVDAWVRDGYRDANRKVNQPEAEAICDEIERLTQDSTMRHRSIGVVSLLGAEQAQLIFTHIIERLGEEIILRHEIRCGDARTFQGSERDVVLLSGVDDRNGSWVMTENKIENVRRINVATSRARDRLYFFHSFARNELSNVDLRARLLDHFAEPIRVTSTAQGRERCESEFEIRVYDALTRHGYRVHPQVHAGHFRIDFVVEGSHGHRLAIECDGDNHHGPERWMDDLMRQRTLERAGWRFWRCWASSYFLDETGCLDDLIRTLTELGIEPIGPEGADWSQLVEHRKLGIIPEAVRSESAVAAAGDFVEIEYIDVPDSKERFLIRDKPSNPESGIIDSESERGRTLIGSSVGSEVALLTSTGIRKARVLNIQSSE